MEIKEILDEIKKRWTDSERYELLSEFNEAPQGASTGGEGLAIEGNFLIDLAVKDPAAYKEVKDLIEKFIIKCREYGTVFKMPD